MVRPPQLPRPDPGKSRPTGRSPWQQNRRGLEFLVSPDNLHDPPLHGRERGRSGEVPEYGELVGEAREIPEEAREILEEEVGIPEEERGFPACFRPRLHE